MRHSRNRGKGAAMETGAEAVRLLDDGRDQPRHLLFLDADLAETAREAAPLVEPVRAGDADMTIAVFSTTVKLGGHGFVVRLSREGVRRATGWEPDAPLNGQRCLTRAAFDAALPLAAGFGVETALTIDLLRQGSGCGRWRCRSRTAPPAPTGGPSCTAASSSGTWRGRSPSATRWWRGGSAGCAAAARDPSSPGPSSRDLSSRDGRAVGHRGKIACFLGTALLGPSVFEPDLEGPRGQPPPRSSSTRRRTW